jgi:hypothetical protein
MLVIFHNQTWGTKAMTRTAIPSTSDLSLSMLPSPINVSENAISTYQLIAYVTIGAFIVSAGLHYASKVNHINEGEPPLLPGALPVLGHALAFMKQRNKVYEKVR